LDEVKNNAPSDDVSVILVGNKKDLIDLREVTTEEAEAFASENKLFFLETSALDNSDQMIEKVFMTLSEDIIKQKDKDDSDDEDGPVGAGGK
jgi:GTPase SAR1 family protein